MVGAASQRVEPGRPFVDGSIGGVSTLDEYGGDLYVGGSFTSTADSAVPNLNHIAKLSGGAWAPLPNQGLSGTVLRLAVNGNNLYTTGSFTETADGAVKNMYAMVILGPPPAIFHCSCRSSPGEAEKGRFATSCGQ